MFVVDIANHLEALGLLTFQETAGGDTFIGHVPAKPDFVVVLTPTPGLAPEYAHAYDYPAFQVRVRGGGADPRPAYDKAMAIRNALHGIESQQIGATWVVKLEAAQSEPASLGTDENGRHEFTLNFNADIRAAALAGRE